MEEGDTAEVGIDQINIYDHKLKLKKRKTHKHIFDLDQWGLKKNEEETYLPKFKVEENKIKKLSLIACGTAFHACMISKYWFEKISKINTDVEIASEYRYRDVISNGKTLGILVSQSGETMDTLKCLQKMKEKKISTLSIINVIGSSIARESDYILPTLAGPEIGVASTKAFTSQLIVLALLSLHLAQKKKLFNLELKKISSSLFSLSKNIEKILKDKKIYSDIAKGLTKSKSIFYIGRGTMYPLALEGALKLKEITYKHCEGYAAGELKHGPLALIEKNVPVIVLAPYDKYFEKTMSNIQEIKARGGEIILITDKQGKKKSLNIANKLVSLPISNFLTAPILYSIPVQLIAYYLAISLGTDVDQPRNLAKSVTVE